METRPRSSLCECSRCGSRASRRGVCISCVVGVIVMCRLRSRLIGAFAAVAAIPSAYADGYGPHSSPQLAVTDWSGFYVGARAGGMWGHEDVTDDITDGVPPGPFSWKPHGFIGGGSAGYNLQFDSIVVGVEGDLGFIDPNGRGLQESHRDWPDRPQSQ